MYYSFLTGRYRQHQVRRELPGAGKLTRLSRQHLDELSRLRAGIL